MSRNALDVAVSLYFQIHKHDFAPHSNNYEKKYSKLSTMERLPPEDMNEFVIYPLWGVENVCRFNRAWLDFAENKPQFFLLKYEDVSDSPKAAIDELCQFVVSDYDVDDLVRKTEFSAMRSIEQKGLMPRGFRHGDPESMKVRRGVVKGYSKYIEPGTVNQARRIASRYGFEI